MKKRALIGKILGVICLLLVAIGASYIIMRFLEKERFSNTNLIVTFEDTKNFTLENVNKLTKEEALSTYPYVFTIQNKGQATVEFKVKINDELSENLQKENLDYIIVQNDKEYASGNLAKINEDFFQSEIKGQATDTYKVYIYLNSEIENSNYSYALTIDAK